MPPIVRIEKYADRDLAKAELRPLLKLFLPFDLRRKSRFRTTLTNGTEAEIFLPRGSVLRDGDLLEAEDGTLVQVESAPEDVLLVTAEMPYELMRAAYHLGNRHTPVELGENFLKIEADPVLKEMLVQLGVTVREENSSFHPEGGAYGGGHQVENRSSCVRKRSRWDGRWLSLPSPWNGTTKRDKMHCAQ